MKMGLDNTPIDMLTARRRMDFTQKQMAEAIGLSMRQQQDIERGAAQLRRTHALAIERVLLAEAVRRRIPSICPYGLWLDAKAVALLMDAEMACLVADHEWANAPI